MRGVLEEDRFSYDGVGNRLTDIANNSYAYNNGNELLTQNGTSFSYDANGNMVSKTDSSGTTSYTFDSENRLVQINTQPAAGNPQLITYKYDPFGRRIEKSVTDTATGAVTVTRYVYDREDILFELDGSGNIVTEFVHGPGIDEPIAMIRGGQTYYYHADGLGSIIAITDSADNVVQRYEYDSFGNIIYQQNSNFIQPYTYTAREYDSESGLYYYRARYYDAKVGRFITQDPFRGFLRNPQTQNRYPYVTNRPSVMIDPYGLVNWGQVGAGATMISGGFITGAVGGILIGVGGIELAAGQPSGAHAMGVGIGMVIGGGYMIYEGGKWVYKGFKDEDEKKKEDEKPDI